jgi:hypothetical protein
MLGHGKPIYVDACFEVQKPLQTCTPCFHTSITLFPHPELCFSEMSMVCALMACYLLESSKGGSSGQILGFIRALACS